MLQRIQSVWLFFAALGAFFTVRLSFYSGNIDLPGKPRSFEHLNAGFNYLPHPGSHLPVQNKKDTATHFAGRPADFTAEHFPVLQSDEEVCGGKLRFNRNYFPGGAGIALPCHQGN